MARLGRTVLQMSMNSAIYEARWGPLGISSLKRCSYCTNSIQCLTTPLLNGAQWGVRTWINGARAATQQAKATGFMTDRLSQTTNSGVIFVNRLVVGAVLEALPSQQRLGGTDGAMQGTEQIGGSPSPDCS